MSSNRKWTVYVTEDLKGVLQYGSEYLNRLEEVTMVPFWKDVITALKSLWKSNMVIDMDCILHIQLWYHLEMQSQLIPECNTKGVRTIWDMVSQNRCALSQQEFEDFYQLRFKIYLSIITWSHKIVS